ncbi:hypothetical protein APU02_22060 [Citrobacter sp. 50677481]|nr:hypothetical protein APU02_22060 [Citrobacter sp. 50677481]
MLRTIPFERPNFAMERLTAINTGFTVAADLVLSISSFVIQNREKAQAGRKIYPDSVDRVAQERC